MGTCKFKKFVKEHKKQILYGVISIVSMTGAATIGFQLGKRVLIHESDFDASINFNNDINIALKDSDTYVPVGADEIADKIGTEVLRDPSGNLLKVKHWFAFGDRIK